MSDIVIQALFSLIGTLVGIVSSTFINNKLTIYRIDQLEQHVNKHNNLIDRMYKVENRVTILEKEGNNI